jgi:prevent-host-death family protein
MLVISSREFRNKQAEYFDRAENGEQIIIQRGKDKAYTLTPVKDKDLFFTPEMIERIKLSIEQAKAGKTVKLRSMEDIKNLLGL